MESGKKIESRLWNAVLKDFSNTFPKDIFRSWFEPLFVVEETDDSIVFGVVNDFTAIWLHENYLDVLCKRLAIEAGHNVSVSFKVQGGNDECSNKQPLQPKQPAKNFTRERDENIFYLNKQNTFENFVVGSGSQMAHAACVAVANAPGKAYNPLFLYGDTGLGKTHLMQAVAHHVLSTSKKANVVYASTEKFTNEFISELQKNNLNSFRKKYRNVDVLLIDDVHFLSGKERIQEEFFHTFNELFQSQKQIILSSDRPASEISKLENRLVSRFQWGLVADIQVPDLETRMAILEKKASAMNLSLARDVIELLANKVSRNVRKLEGALTRIASYVSITHAPVNTDLVSHILRDLFDEENIEITVETVQRRTCSHFHISYEDIIGKKRPASIAFPRQIAMYLCRIMTSLSLSEIGEAFGGRDHGTVIHACKTVENAIEQDPAMKQTIDSLQNAIKRCVR